MKKYICNLFLGVFSLSIVSIANAQAYVLCDVVADQYLIQSNGLLSVRYRLLEPRPGYSPENLFATVCRIGGEYRSVSAETCLAWQNMFTDSIETGKPLRLRFSQTVQQSINGCLGNDWTNSPPPDYIIYNFNKFITP